MVTSDRPTRMTASKGPTIAELLGMPRELLFYSMTPPRKATSEDRVQDIADAALARLRSLDVDALILYDLDDESDRIGADRPFPYLETRDPAEFLAGPLRAWKGNSIVYRCAGKYDESELIQFLATRGRGDATVFVGPSSSDKPVRTSLARAMQLRREACSGVPLGAVAIPERHARGGGEDQRLLHKQHEGADFFVTQVVYDTGEAKDMVSDYAYACEERGLLPARVVFTLSLCGSERTLDFLQWLGVDVPRWVQNELRHSRDTLEASFEHCLSTARELARFCRYLSVPFGFNIESVSTRRVEIDATVELGRQVGALLVRERGGPAPSGCEPSACVPAEV